MEAYCNPIIEYSTLSEAVKKQKESFQNLTSQFLNVKRRYKSSDLEKNIKKARHDVIKLNQIFKNKIIKSN